MEKIKIPTSFNIELEFETPEFHRRIFAWIIDLFILFAYFIIIYNLLSGISANHKNADNDMPFLYNLSSVYLLLFSPVLLYHLVCELILNGQSLGKKMLHIKVISEDGGRPALHQYLIRWLLRPFDFSFFCLPGLLTVINTRKNQRLGDLAAGTIVIKTKMETDLDDTVFLKLDNNYKPRFKEVMRLSDSDMNVIKGVLNSCREHKNFDLALRTGEKICAALNIQQYGEPVEFLEILLKDYNFYANQN